MPMTPEERTWLNGQRADLMVLVTQAEVYAGALRIYEDTPPAAWRLLARWKRRQGMGHCTRKYRLLHTQAVLLCAALDTWIAAHNILTGEARGPVIR